MAYSSVTSTYGFPWEMHYGTTVAPHKLPSWLEGSPWMDYLLRFSLLSYHCFFSNPNRQVLHVRPCHWPWWPFNSPCTAVIQHSPSFSQPLWRNAFPDWQCNWSNLTKQDRYVKRFLLAKGKHEFWGVHRNKTTIQVWCYILNKCGLWDILH